MQEIKVYEIARVLNLDPAQVRKWDGYDSDTDTVLLTEAEVRGLWLKANKPRSRLTRT